MGRIPSHFAERFPLSPAPEHRPPRHGPRFQRPGDEPPKHSMSLEESGQV